MCSAGVAVSDFTASKRVENAAIGGTNVIQLAAETANPRLRSALLSRSAAVRFINHDTVVAANRHRLIGLQRALDQRLHRGDADFGITVFRNLSVNPLISKMLLKASPLMRVSSTPLSACLAERATIDQNRTRLETLRLDQTEIPGRILAVRRVLRRYRSPSLQDVLPIANDAAFHRADSIFPGISAGRVRSFRVSATTGFVSAIAASAWRPALPDDAIPAKRAFDILVVCRTRDTRYRFVFHRCAVFAPVAE